MRQRLKQIGAPLAKMIPEKLSWHNTLQHQLGNAHHTPIGCKQNFAPSATSATAIYLSTMPPAPTSVSNAKAPRVPDNKHKRSHGATTTQQRYQRDGNKRANGATSTQKRHQRKGNNEQRENGATNT